MEEHRFGVLYEDGSAVRKPAPLPVLPEEQLQPQRQTTLVVQEKLGVSLFAVIGVAVVAVLFALMIGSYMRLFAVTNANAGLESQLEDLQAENAKLQATYDSSYDLKRIETYAQVQLGMRQPTDQQMIYLDLSGSDEAVVLAGDGQGVAEIWQTFRESFAYLLQSVRSFFGG